jgi:hypothetical protein
LIVLAKWFHVVINPASDYVLFFIFPFLAIYLIMLPLIPVIGFFLSIFASAMYNIPGAWMFTFAPIMGFLLAISNLYTGGIVNIFAWGMSLLIFIFGFVMGFVNVAWWAMIGIALWGIHHHFHDHFPFAPQRRNHERDQRVQKEKEGFEHYFRNPRVRGRPFNVERCFEDGYWNRGLVVYCPYLKTKYEYGNTCSRYFSAPPVKNEIKKNKKIKK